MIFSTLITRRDGSTFTEYRGLHSDNKPVYASLGDVFMELDSDVKWSFTENGWVVGAHYETDEGDSSSSWNDISDKPFETIGEGLTVEDGALKASGGSGSGLPDPTDLTDGTAMVVVDGEWTMQEGYGYVEESGGGELIFEGSFEAELSPEPTPVPIAMYIFENARTFSEINPGDQLIITYDGTDYVATAVMSEPTPGLSMLTFGGALTSPDPFSQYPFVGVYRPGEGAPSNGSGIYCSTGGEHAIKIERDIPRVVHKIDSKYIPNQTLFLTFAPVPGGFTCDKTPEEIVSAHKSGCDAIGEVENQIVRLIAANTNSQDVYTMFQSIFATPSNGSILQLMYARINGELVTDLKQYTFSLDTTDV